MKAAIGVLKSRVQECFKFIDKRVKVYLKSVRKDEDDEEAALDEEWLATWDEREREHDTAENNKLIRAIILVLGLQLIRERCKALLEPYVLSIYKQRASDVLKHEVGIVLPPGMFDDRNLAHTIEAVENVAFRVLPDSVKTNLQIAISKGDKFGLSSVEIIDAVKHGLVLQPNSLRRILDHGEVEYEEDDDFDIGEYVDVESRRGRSYRALLLGLGLASTAWNDGFLSGIGWSDTIYVMHKTVPGACEICLDMDGNVYTTVEALGIIPVHPNCRCYLVPFYG